MSEVVNKERDAKGKFLPGHGGRKPGIKQRLTVKMLERVEEYNQQGKTTPVDYWLAILNNDPLLRLDELAMKDYHTVKLKAAESLAKYIYDPSFNTEEAESMRLSPEQIEALKGAFPQFKRN